MLIFKQSKKVTTFGEHTMGAVDYLDLYLVQSPTKKYKMYIPTTRRIIPPGQSKLDGVGITPNIKISDTVPDWIEYVKDYYEKH